MEKSITGLAILLAVCTLVLGVSIGYIASPEKVVTNTITTAPIVTQAEYNDTAIKADIANVQATLDADDVWESQALVIAEAEWNDEDELYDAILSLGIVDLDDEGDIYKVVIRDSDVANADSDDSDADVSQEVRVYYENSTGDNVRVTLDIDTEIVDSEAEDVTYALA
mgnify:CR=1 FL=1